MKLLETIKKFDITQNSQRTRNSSSDSLPKPFIQWVGGKREMIPQYKTYIPKQYKKYFEPFLGGGAMFFYLQPKVSHLCDNNLELIRTYEGVRDNPNLVIEILKELKARHSKELYSEIRNFDRQLDIFTELSNDEIAARMIYLNQTCFNGVYRVNQKSQFNVPIGSSLNRLICDEPTIMGASSLLKNANIKCADFVEATQQAGKNDFVYFDPPYYPVSAYSDFNRYTKEKFYKEDQERLKKHCDELSSRGCLIMLSNSDCDFINDLYKGYKKVKVLSSRSLNCKSEKRGKVSELLITNY